MCIIRLVVWEAGGQSQPMLAYLCLFIVVSLEGPCHPSVLYLTEFAIESRVSGYVDEVNPLNK